MLSHNTVLQTPLGIALSEAIRERGAITFAAFMQLALYDPEDGYYTRQERSPFGWEGDFITSSDLHPLFGATIGSFLVQVWEWLSRPQPFYVLEDGAGRGLLARDIIDWAKKEAPAEFADHLHYTLRDIDPVAGQKFWLANSAPYDGPLEGQHVILSNELVDAFPVHVLQRAVEGLREVYVTASDASPYLSEYIGPLSEPDVLLEYLKRSHVDWENMPVGWRAEINLEAEAWMAAMSHLLGPRGIVLTIDYGDVADRLYIPERMRGTLLAYHQHRMSEDVLAHVGAQDLTAYVNFSDLIATGSRNNLQAISLHTQRDFLLALGIREAAEGMGRQLYPKAESERSTDAGQVDYLRLSSLRHRVAALIAPGGIGAFRVLLQHRGLYDALIAWHSLKGLPVLDRIEGMA
jgi:SAM-dependent MidA family methyltransferase